MKKLNSIQRNRNQSDTVLSVEATLCGTAPSSTDGKYFKHIVLYFIQIVNEM